MLSQQRLIPSARLSKATDLLACLLGEVVGGELISVPLLILLGLPGRGLGRRPSCEDGAEAKTMERGSTRPRRQDEGWAIPVVLDAPRKASVARTRKMAKHVKTRFPALNLTGMSKIIKKKGRGRNG